MTRSRNSKWHPSSKATLGALALALAACSAPPDSERAAIEASILNTSGQEELWRTILEEYPDDFAALVSEIETLDPQQRSDEAVVEQAGARWLQTFFERVAPDAVRAPSGQLLAWSKAEHALYKSLQSAATPQCAQLTMGEWITIDPDNLEATSAIARRNAAMVRAASAGRQMPSDYADPNEQDLQQFGNAIAATGLAPPLQAALGSTEQMEALTATQQCAIGVAVYEALTALPDEDEPVMAAYMLAPE